MYRIINLRRLVNYQTNLVAFEADPFVMFVHVVERSVEVVSSLLHPHSRKTRLRISASKFVFIFESSTTTCKKRKKFVYLNCT